MMKNLFSIGFLALFGLACTLNGAEASHFRPLSVMVNKPIGEEVIMEETTPEPAEKMEETQEENLEKPASDPVAPAMENDEFDGVWESSGCETSCCEEENPCCCVRRSCWARRCWRRMMRRCCCAPAPMTVTETGSDCGCGE
ncbi:MAG: hypothetical protein IJK97_13480 [Thermoguttaceae bacterium]|nr:hypothetical protein [Thermoguttaceae bacterium]MBR0191245.1 hypothetical protein [Thermoguttaceae bacterium]